MKSYSKILLVSAAILALLSCSKENSQNSENAKRPVPELVDLGLSVKWGSFNLGASNPEEYGGYYQWAGTTDVTNNSIMLDWENCPYHIGPYEACGWTKYIPLSYPLYWSGPGNPDDKTILEPSDDAAQVKLGGKWRIPTYKEWTELLNNSTSEWTTLEGVSGRRFTSKKNGNSIFLPAVGRRKGGLLEDYGTKGYYCSSSLTPLDPHEAYCLYFDANCVEIEEHPIYDSYRYLGLPVRPVSK